MKRIIIRFIGLGFGSEYQAHVIIYDDCSNVIYDGYTCKGYIILSLENNKAYKLVATSLGECVSIIFYVSDKTCDYRFIFNRSIYSNIETITFLLTDYYYDNLPIEKGELILWPSQ